jgi:hypothetical protein
VAPGSGILQDRLIILAFYDEREPIYRLSKTTKAAAFFPMCTARELRH